MSANNVEKLAYWYLRLNGYFTVENFSIHPDTNNDRGTDADLLAVRFPYSTENPLRYNFERDHTFIVQNKIDFLIVEVKSSRCEINIKTWGNPEEKHVQYALRWMGFYGSGKEIDDIANQIYNPGIWSNDSFCVRHCCFGEKENPDLQIQHPMIVQKKLIDLTEYLRQRFSNRCLQIHHENWDDYCQQFAEKVHKYHLTSQELLDWTLTVR